MFISRPDFFEIMKHFVLSALVFAFSASQAQLIINEASQGLTGSQEYVELLVIGNPTCGSSNTVDLRGWIIDDNNSWHASGSGTGIASGHVKFDSIAQWANVKIGSLILIYNDGDVGASVSALTNDVSDSNNDCVYIVPVSSSVLRKNTDLPLSGNTMTTYAVPGTTYSGVGNWLPLGMANGGDAFHTVSPANYAAPYHAIGWGNNTAQVNAYFSGSQSASVIIMANTVDNDPFNGANYSSVAASGNETPGAPNNAANAAWIASINNNCQTIAPTYPTTTRNISLCPGQSVVINGVTVTTAGTYIDTIPATIGCDTVRTNNVTVGSYITDSRAVQLCPGQSTVINGQTVSTAGTYNDTIPGTGCDTLRTYNVTTQTYNQKTQAVALCSGQSIVINGQTITTNGTYLDTVSSPTTCDTIITYNVTFANYITDSRSVQLCPGQSTVINGQTITTAGTYNDTLQASVGCDTVRTYTVTTSPFITKLEFYSLCQGQSITVRGNTYSTAGSYLDTVASATTCDTVFTYSITVNSFIPSSVTLTACQGQSITVNGTAYTSNTQFNDTISGGASCDTIRTYQLTFFPVYNNTNNVTICQGQTYFAGGAQQSTSGTYTDTYTTVNGCDSIIQTNLTVAQPDSSTQQETVCSGDAFNGTVYTTDTVLVYTYTNVSGCDSVVTYNLTIAPKPVALVSADTTIESGQSAILVASGGTDYLWNGGETTASITVAPTQTQTYLVNVANANSCSDTATVTVTVNQPKEQIPLIPTAFSPNGDGVNDVFDIVNRSLFDVEAFRVYNRWGELVFESTTDGWDGTFRNTAQPIGTFVYYAEVRNLAGTKVYSLKGNVTLLR